MANQNSPTDDNSDAGLSRAERELRQVAEGEKASVSGARLFDLRYLIGGLFVVYGAILSIVGMFDGGAELTKADGIRINLWLGLAMFVLGALFLLWAWLRPLQRDTEAADKSD